MPLTTHIPPIKELIPHRGTMLFIDRVIAFESSMAVAEYTPRHDAWYVDSSGHMPAWIGLELMAQTVAAHVALMKRLEGSSPKMGALLGTNSYRSSVASFAAGGVLSIRVDLLFNDPSGMGAYIGAIECNNIPLANSTLKVYEPEDFERFVQGNLS